MKYKQKQFLFDVMELTAQIITSGKKYESIYGVPRGGIPLACALSISLKLPLTDNITDKTLIVDDLVDSGDTRIRHHSFDFACIHLKSHCKRLPTYFLYNVDREWIEYFWEGESKEDSVFDNITRIIQYIGEDQNREGLKETPMRVVKSWDHLFSGYNIKEKDLIKTFDADGHDEMILLKDIELYSMCEHHMLPFIGKVHVAYIPDKSIIGISKLARIVEMYARRLQIQERICSQVTELLMKELKPKGAACIIEAQHLCMQMRGVQKQNSVMTTSSLKGAFLEKQEARQELMRLIK